MPTEKKPRPPTPQGISNLLRDAGFARSERHRRIRGFAEWTEGYLTDELAAGTVEVEYRPATIASLNMTFDDERRKMEPYRKAVEDAGYAVQDGDSVIRCTFIVTLPNQEGSS